MVVRQPGQLTPLMFHGPTSVGKTHLLEGIWTAARKTHQRLTTVYLSAEQFTSHFLEALRGSGLPSFRRKYRGVGLLILDDLQFFVGKRATQIELLHTVDTLLARRAATGLRRRPLAGRTGRTGAGIDHAARPAAWSAASSRPTTPPGWASSAKWPGG